jgi:hypothetical protein
MRPPGASEAPTGGGRTLLRFGPVLDLANTDIDNQLIELVGSRGRFGRLVGIVAGSYIALSIHDPRVMEECLMAVAPTMVQAGRCYETALGQVRRVLKVENGNVAYQEQNKTDTGGVSRQQTSLSLERFARDIQREVPCR